MEPYYDAYRTFAHIINSSEFQFRFKLNPGDLFITDNTRVLSGRTAFINPNRGGVRHLQCCFAERDSLYSCLNVLSRHQEEAF
jgi:gamma-butyrobetaine dioxygenase